MFELLLNPVKAERKPWELFFVGLFYASLSILFVNWIFASNPIFSKYLSILTITFTVILSMPFVYFTMRLEEEKEVRAEGSLLKEHGKAVLSFLWLFFGFLIAFSLFYILFPEFTGQNFQAQIEQYCNINMPTHFKECVKQYSGSLSLTGSALDTGSLIDIFVNNVYVLIFSLIFSLIFGAGAIFILAWNASVIATAIGIFSKSSIENLPISVLRYIIHGLPEIAAYFTAALAGGIIGIAIIRNDIRSERFWHIIKDSLDLVIIALLILVAAALIEVFITFRLF